MKFSWIQVRSKLDVPGGGRLRDGGYFVRKWVVFSETEIPFMVICIKLDGHSGWMTQSSIFALANIMVQWFMDQISYVLMTMKDRPLSFQPRN